MSGRHRIARGETVTTSHCYSAAALALAAMLSISGCAGGGSPLGVFKSSDDAELTPAQQELREESDRFKWTRVQGAALGAVTGAVAGWFITDDWKGAAGGAAVGGVLGYAAGYYIDSVNQEYANEQEALNTRIDAAGKDVDRYDKAAADARQVVNQHKATIAELNAEYASQQITAEQYGAKVASIQGDIEALQGLIKESSGNLELMDKDIAALREKGANVGGLSVKRDALASKRDALQAQLDTLAVAIGSIPDAVSAPEVS
jgi:DNA repair exonuclease SbcCD ATPase subunit